MNYAFLLFMILHGIMHLAGFIHQQGLASVLVHGDWFSSNAFLFWLLASMLFVISGFTYFTGKYFWAFFALAGTALSVMLIAGNWAEARWGIIPNIIIACVAVAGLASCNMNRMVARETEELLSTLEYPQTRLVTEADVAGLPPAVKNWLHACGMVNRPYIQSVWAAQSALMKMKPGQENWYAAEAQQYATTQIPGFIWTVKMKMSPFITIRGRDKYMDGRGEMRIQLNSLFNIVNERGARLDEGTLQRFLGELVWMPSLALSPYITWEEIDAYSARAIMTYKGVSGDGVFYFNEKGDFVKFIADRYMGNDESAQRYPWMITVDEYAIYQGIKIPSQMKASWMLEEGEWTWLKLKIKDLKFNIEGISASAK